MSSLPLFRHMLDHLYWSDRRILDALRQVDGASAEAVREYAHIIGSEENWLARLTDRASRLPIWPHLTFGELEDFAERVHREYVDFLESLREGDFDRPIAYVNSAGRAFENSVGDILLHVALHGQYHRGKVNLLLRQSGAKPAPTDYIAFARGVPAATEGDVKHRHP